MIMGSASTDTPLGTGGSNSIKLAVGNLPSHTHTIAAHTHSVGNHTHTLNNHTHTIPNHAHTVPAHNHTASSNSTGAHTHGVTSDDSGKANSFVGGGKPAGTTIDAGILSDNTIYHSYTAGKKVIIGSAGAHSHTITVANKASFATTTATGLTSGASNVNTSSAGGGNTGSAGSGNTGANGSGTVLDITNAYIKLFIWQRTE